MSEHEFDACVNAEHLDCETTASEECGKCRALLCNDCAIYIEEPGVYVCVGCINEWVATPPT